MFLTRGLRLSDVTAYGAVAGRSRCGYEGRMFDGAPFANLSDDAFAFGPVRDAHPRGDFATRHKFGPPAPPPST